MVNITQEDLNIILQTLHSSTAFEMKMKLEVLDGETIVGVINGIVNGTLNISAESDVRRTATFTLQPTHTENIKLGEDNLVWINKDVRLTISLFDRRNGKYKDYLMGNYCYTNTSATYNSSTNQLSLSCSDFVTKLDGTKNGQLGALNIIYPAYEESDTGDPIKYNIIRDAIIATLKDLAHITRYRVDDVGEYKALQSNKEWAAYREENPLWNAIPYDQEFSCGTSVLNIIKTFVELYPGFELFFDPETNEFVVQQIPMCYDDDIALHDNFVQKVIQQESITTDLSKVRNICEVWGQVIETDYFTEDSSYVNNTYSVSLDGFTDEYKNNDTVSFRVHSTNTAGSYININSFGGIPILNEYDDSPIEAGVLLEDNVYSFKVKKKRVNGETVTKAYYIGQWQVHAIDVLTNGKTGEDYETQDGVIVKKYSKDYFKAVYNCEVVNLTVVPDSPFTVQKIGEILDVKNGGDFDNITSSDLAMERARWENWKNCRLTDNITITTLLLPFLDVNQKIEYRPQTESDTRQYLVQTIAHDFTNFTSTITMYRFYPYYMDESDIDTDKGTHDSISQWTHDLLSNYSYQNITKL